MEIMRYEVKIGDYLTAKGVPVVRCIKGTGEIEDCGKCCFHGADEYCNKMICTDLFRKDKKSVYFVKIKVKDRNEEV